MKLIILFAGLSFLQVIHTNICTKNDPSTCTHTCPVGEAKTCEHEICTCAPSCIQVSDCADCPSNTDPMGHVTHEKVHCVDSVCKCLPEHVGPHHPDGGPPGGR
ncbi:serine protease inhibitor Cvsi-2-like [Mercenaria mercenaria]|uniref:serine protease inhibitor Cvsi-2-like n=1 Tax=Mercenaria mercenaria TaxID=6596 RepID=UPI00234EB701|nr:serine protease inhibitor Cvsi-2-like [Mercenaria mercenaria]